MIETLLFFEENSLSATPSELSTVQQQFRSYSWYLQAPQIRRAERLEYGPMPRSLSGSEPAFKGVGK